MAIIGKGGSWARQWWSMGLLALAAGAVWADGPRGLAFAAPGDLAGLEVKGDATIDGNEGHAAKGALRLGPGSQALWKLRGEDGSGRITMWVKEDGARLPEPKTAHCGPCWGLRQADGRSLVLGIFYAPYLSGAETVTFSEIVKPGEWNRKLQYVGQKREAGWAKFTFDCDPEKGLSVSVNDKPIKRFDWNKTEFLGFNSLILCGDAEKSNPHVIWVDDVEATLGGPMKAKPTAPPPPPPVVPAQDPQPEQPLSLLPAVQGQHPRLLWTAADLPAMKARAQGPAKPYFDQVCAYLPASAPPTDNAWVSNDTDAQRQGFWRSPTIAVHYAATGDPKTLAKGLGMLQAFMKEPSWQKSGEVDSGMGAANVDFGAALLYDALYNDLDPAFREQVRQRLLLQARRMYYGGHLMKNPGIHYWQNDPQNNHRWHRLAGLVATTLAAWEPNDPNAQWILQETRKELQFIHDWLPADGTFHDSPSYMIFGTTYAVVAMDMSDRCLGTTFMRHPFFVENARFRLHTLLPGFGDSFRYGDGSGLGFFNNYFFRGLALAKERDLQAGLLAFYAKNNSGNAYGWPAFLWFDPSLAGGSLDKVEKTKLYPDLGIVSVRDGWEKQNVAALFKCGPYGGYKLNEFRNRNHFAYINVAHDHPDANMFEIYCQGEMVATDDSYPQPKWTKAHNTILVNGKGQLQEGQGFTQPFRSGAAARGPAAGDMTRTATLIGWKDTGDVVVAEGEAAGLYPDLQSFRRTFIWAKGRYVLVLDDIRAGRAHKLAWLLHSGSIRAPGPAGEPGQLKEKAAVCAFLQASSLPPEYVVTDEAGNDHGKATPRGQVLQADVQSDEWRLATVFDAWSHGKLTLTAKDLAADRSTLTIAGPGFRDTWTWNAATDRWTPSALELKPEQGAAVAVTASDLAPQEWLKAAPPEQAK